MRDPWTILGVVPGAGARQIHAAWRKGVSKWHPDRNPSPEATLRLQEINDAYASLRSGTPTAAVPTWPVASGSVLSGLSGTVFGEPYADAEATGIAPDCMQVELEIPSLRWLLDEPVTLAIAGIGDVFTLVTLLRPGELHDGSRLVFRGAGLSPTELTTDLVVTIRVALPAVAPPVAEPVRGLA